MNSRTAIPEKAQLILLKLYDLNREVTKSTLLKIVPNMYSLEKNLRLLQEEGLVNIREEVIIRRSYMISLTEKGKSVAAQLRKAEEAVKGIPQPIDTSTRKVEQDFIDFMEKASQIVKAKAYDDHVIMEDASINDRVTLLLKHDENGIPRLWCDRHQSFECFHTKYSWTLRDVQEMYYKYSVKKEHKDQ